MLNEVLQSVSIRGTSAADWDKLTWKVFDELARNHPDAGVHFQECEIHSRAKDAGGTTAKWFAELLSSSPWFKDVVPNVSSSCGMEALFLIDTSSGNFLKIIYTRTSIPLRRLLRSASIPLSICHGLFPSA